MFDRIFGDYLLKKGHLTQQQLDVAFNDEAHAFVKLGVLAASERFMTEDQAREINHMQSGSDRRFGDIAIEKGYLTPTQLDSLLKRQGNVFFHFLQTIINLGYYSLEELDGFLKDYQNEMEFSNAQMDSLVSGDVLRVVNVFLPQQDRLYGRLCGIAIRTFLRLIDSRAYIERAYVTNRFETDRFACQKSYGTHTIVVGFAGRGDNLLPMACAFGREKFETVDMDALDSVAEFANCVDGLFATEIYSEGVDVDMTPPMLYDHPVSIEGYKFCIVPINSFGCRIELIMALDSMTKVRELSQG
jgi:hypothetical protein